MDGDKLWYPCVLFVLMKKVWATIQIKKLCENGRRQKQDQMGATTLYRCFLLAVRWPKFCFDGSRCRIVEHLLLANFRHTQHRLALWWV